MSPNGKAFWFAAGPVLAFDLFTKWLVMARFELHESLPVMPGLALTYVRNQGAAFSLFAGFPEWFRRPFFIAVPIFAFWALRQYFKGLPASDRLSALALGLVMGGAFGNLVDRVRYGAVVDFVEVNLGFPPLNPWPVFNVADSAIFIGVGLLLYRAWRPLAQPKEGASPAPQP